LVECQICSQYTDRLAEIIAHPVLEWIKDEEGFWRLVHVKPNSTRDIQGKDFFIVPDKDSRYSLFIQIKPFRILSPEKLMAKIKRIQREPDENKPRRVKRFWEEKFHNPAQLQRYMRGVIVDYFKLNLIINDQEIRKGFKLMEEQLSLQEILNKDSVDQNIFQIFGKIEHFIDVFAKVVRHHNLYPTVKLVLLVNTTEGTILENQSDNLKKIWLPLIIKAVQ